MPVLPDSLCELPARRAPGLLLLAKFPVCDPHRETWESGSKWPPGQLSCLPRPERFPGVGSFRHQPWGSCGQTRHVGHSTVIYFPPLLPVCVHYLSLGFVSFEKCSQFLLGVRVGGGLCPKLELYWPVLTPEAFLLIHYPPTKVRLLPVDTVTDPGFT